MEKVSRDFVIDQYRSGIKSYTDFTTEVGLWDSEQYVFQKYLKPQDRILDIGCGTGRTTFGLYQLDYQNIRGLDLTPEMISSAQELNLYFGTDIPFMIGDATQLEYADDQFDRAIFSFNGLMSIPQVQNRRKAVQEIHRVLKPGGTFIFTTHDREKDENYFQFWCEERERWAAGQQKAELYEFGDLLTKSKNESRQIFIHIPNQAEVLELLAQAGFRVLETFYRDEQFKEPTAVKMKSGECRFWVARSKDKSTSLSPNL